MARSIEIRQLQQECVTDDQIKAIMAKLVEMALAGDLKAAVEVFNRICGKPMDAYISDGDQGNQYAVLVTSTAEAIKKLEENRSLGDDPLRGIKRLPKGDGT